MSFAPSVYQQEIFKWMKNGSGHGMVNAVAGSGKSTTLEIGARDCISYIDTILSITFTKAIQTASAARMPRNCRSVTFNSLGWQLCRTNIPGVMLDKDKNLKILRGQVTDAVRFKRIKPPLLRMVDLLKSLGEGNIDRWQEHARFYGVELGDVKPEDQFEDALNEVYLASIHETRVMDFADQIFQPIFRGWQMPAFDWTLIDESQDSSPTNIEMAKMLSRAGRLILVGDPDQSIYLFRGAHPSAMEELGRELKTADLPLSICWRCPNAIIKQAQEIVPRIEAPDPNPNGEGEVEWMQTEEFVRNVQDGDLVLCRTTAPLIKRCLEQLRRGRRAYVRGRELVTQIIDLVEHIHGNPMLLEQQVFQFKQWNRLPPPDITQFLQNLREYRLERTEQLTKADREAELMALEDRCETVETFALESRFVGEIIVKVEAITSDSEQEGIQFMTGHRAKGLESGKENDVYILRPDLSPHPRAKSAVQLKQEKNLQYVMWTRGRRGLYFVQKERDEK